MRITEYWIWEERLRSGLLSFFFISLCLPIAIQQTALGILLAFLAYEVVGKHFLSKSSKFQVLSSKSENPQSVIHNPQSFSSPLDLPLLLFLAALLLSTCFSPAVASSLTGYRKLWLIGAFFATYHLLRKPQEAQRLISLMIIVATVLAAYGIVQHFTGIDWARELVGKKPSVDLLWFGQQERFRTEGLYPSGITYAHNLLFPLTFTSVLLFMPGLAWHKRLMLIGGWGLMVCALLFSLTRGVWIAYAIVLFMLGFVRGRKTLGGVAIVVIILSLFLLNAEEGVQERLGSIAKPAANSGRSFIWQANLDMARERPLLGWGYGNYKHFRTPYYQRYPGADRKAHAHNNFLQVWVESGLLGLSAFLALFWVMLRRGWQVYRRLSLEPYKSLAFGGFLGLIGFLIGGMTQYNFGDGEVVIVLWATVGLLLRLSQWVEEEKIVPTYRLPGKKPLAATV